MMLASKWNVPYSPIIFNVISPFSFCFRFRMSRDLYPRAQISTTTDQIENELNESRYELNDLILMLEQQTVSRHYDEAVKNLCGDALFGLSIMTVAALVTAFLLTLLVIVDSHTWIYLGRRYVFAFFSQRAHLMMYIYLSLVSSSMFNKLISSE